MDYLRKKVLYDNIPPVSKSICLNRLIFSGHCWHGKNEFRNELSIWSPIHGR